MNDSQKLGKNFIIIGVMLMLFSIPNFYITIQKKSEAGLIRRTNKTQAVNKESSANFNRTLAIVKLFQNKNHII